MDLHYLHRLSRQIKPRTQDEPSDETAVRTDQPLELLETRDHRPAARRHRSTSACEVCGRTLLTGEVAAPVDVKGTMVYACPLCAIRVETDARRRAA